MKTRIILTVIFLNVWIITFSQNGELKAQSFTGKISGWIIDRQENEGLPYVPIQLYSIAHNNDSGSVTAGQLSDETGYFSIGNIDTSKNYLIRIKVLGYIPIEIPVSFKNNVVEINLGKIHLNADVKKLSVVEIDGSEPALLLEMDKKVYNVDKNPISAGGTAEDVLKNVPGVSVDMDGNIAVNNASPQLLIDGRPTTLTLDQISAGTIENVEVITNPSAKYDASGGTGGIINITLKKSKRIGYYGTIKASIDMFGKITSGFDFNFRKNKLNVFASGDYNQRMSESYGENERNYLSTNPSVNLMQSFDALFTGLTMSARGGFDYAVNKKNALTFTYSYNQGKFMPLENFYVQTDSIDSTGTTTSYYVRKSDITRQSYTSNASVFYKHSFAKPKHELTADVNLQINRFDNENYYHTQDFDQDSNATSYPYLQEQFGNSHTQIIIIQSDYVNPINEKNKLEAGLRAYVKEFSSNSNDYLFDYNENSYLLIPELTNNYMYSDQVYAAYVIYSGGFRKINLQTGLRTESSFYKGEIIDSSLSFSNQYLFSLFPSIYVSRKLSDKHNFQIGYSRRINRPGFFQLTPYIDYTDSLNVKHGNPLLQPEFTSTAELNYQYIINGNNNVLATVYAKSTNNLISSYQIIEYNYLFEKDIIINTYENANASYAYGIELISKNKIKNSVDITASANIFNAIVDGSNLQENLKNQLFCWSSKLNMNVKLPFNFSYQLSGNYQSKMITPASGGNLGRETSSFSGGGGGSWWNAQSSILQGYSLPRYDIDMGIKFDFLKNKMASITFNVSDVFKTKRQANYYETEYYTQTVYRIRNPQYYKLSFIYKFGKQDPALLKRKGNNSEFDSEM